MRDATPRNGDQFFLLIHANSPFCSYRGCQSRSKKPCPTPSVSRLHRSTGMSAILSPFRITLHPLWPAVTSRGVECLPYIYRRIYTRRNRTFPPSRFHPPPREPPRAHAPSQTNVFFPRVICAASTHWRTPSNGSTIPQLWSIRNSNVVTLAFACEQTVAQFRWVILVRGCFSRLCPSFVTSSRFDRESAPRALSSPLRCDALIFIEKQRNEKREYLWRVIPRKKLVEKANPVGIFWKFDAILADRCQICRTSRGGFKTRARWNQSVWNDAVIEGGVRAGFRRARSFVIPAGVSRGERKLAAMRKGERERERRAGVKWP